MSRAFVSESDGFNFCREYERNCPEANLRGRCELDRCKYITEEKKTDQQEKSLRNSI